MSGGMMKIGDFSRLAQVSVRTLRLYDEMNLLKPAQVDRFTDYRHYDVKQLPRLNRILALKDMGLSLDEIASLLERDMPLDQLRTLLESKKAQLESEFEVLQARLARIAQRLNHIEREGDLPAYEIKLKAVDEVVIAGCRQIVPTLSAMGACRNALYEKLYRGLDRGGIRPGSVEFALYHNAEYTETDIDMEAATTLEGEPRRLSSGELVIRTLPAAPCVVWTVHHGPLPQVVEAIQALFLWIGENGFESNGAIRELHHHFRERDLYPQSDEDPVVTLEVQVPVRETDSLPN